MIPVSLYAEGGIGFVFCQKSQNREKTTGRKDAAEKNSAYVR